MKKGGRLRAVSVKRRAANAQLAESRAAVIDRSFGRCEANTPACPVGDHWGEHAHHVKLRRHCTPAELVAVDNLLFVCSAGHDWIHANPAESYENGWLVRGVTGLQNDSEEV